MHIPFKSLPSGTRLSVASTTDIYKIISFLKNGTWELVMLYIVEKIRVDKFGPCLKNMML